MEHERKKIILIALVSLIVITGIILGYKIYGNSSNDSSSNDNKTVTLEGYIIDQHCVASRKGKDETVMCLKMPVCEKSGYGLAVDINSDKDKFVKFDEGGHNAAKKLVNDATTAKLDKVIVKGHYDNNNFIVESIEGK